ncbi:MAG: Flp pilus assembly protein TadD, partial [Paracoccaceae bacterium]
VELAPTNAGHHVQLGRMQIDAGQFLEAIATLEKAVGINAEIPNVHRQLSRAYECLGQDAEAMKMAKEALKLYPENREYQRWQDKLAAV